MNYNLYNQGGDLAAFDEAVADERKAAQAWHEMVAAAGDFYTDEMWFGTTGRGFPHHWKDEARTLDSELDALLAERQSATAGASAKPARIPARDLSTQMPTVTFVQRPPTPAAPGRDYVVKVKVTAPEGLKWIHLRYRHVDQTEDYQTADMALEAQTGLYAANIPSAFIDPRWDLMYFIEIVDRRGNGRIYPDLEVETPYLVTGVQR